MIDSPAILAALAAIRDCDTRRADALVAVQNAAPAYVVKAFSYGATRERDREALAAALPYCPDAEPLPDTLSPHETYGDAHLVYKAPTVGDFPAYVAALRDRHPAIPIAVFRSGCYGILPPGRGARFEKGRPSEQQPIADFIVKARAVADQPVVIEIEWYTEPAPGVVLRIAVETARYDIAGRVRYQQTNARERGPRMHDEDRQWSASWTWGAGSSSIKGWASPGGRNDYTWTWPPGTTIDHAIGETP